MDSTCADASAGSTPAPGAGAAICLSCRLILDAERSCPRGGSHTVVSLETDDGRASLVAHVIRNTREKRVPVDSIFGHGISDAKGLLISLGMFVSVFGAFAAAHKLGVGLDGALFGLAVVVGVGTVSVFIFSRLIPRRRQRVQERCQVGAERTWPKEGARYLGVIERGNEEPSPSTGRPCVAYAFALLHPKAEAGPVVLRKEEAFGFEVRLEDGRLVRVGRGWLNLNADDPVERFSLPPLIARLKESDAFRYEETAETLLRVGDHVELFGNLEPVIDSDAPMTYREAPQVVLLSRGFFSIRRIES